MKGYHKLLLPLLAGCIFYSILDCEEQEYDTEPSLIIEPADNLNYQLIWSDEFELDGKPDPEKWTHEYGFVRNNEAQWYQEDNAWIENGLLIIEGREESFPNPNYDPKSKDWRYNRPQITYTSASVRTKNRFTWKYGRCEVKAKIVTEEGLWPAIWTLGEGHEWPSGGEVDIMEYYGGYILANAAWADEKRWKAIWDGFKKPVRSFKDPEWDQKFHTWHMDWDTSAIKLYLDDELLNTIDLSQTINKRGNIDNPFRKAYHYLILNLALGGNAGGSLDHTRFPTRYEIDYVRIYQLM